MADKSYIGKGIVYIDGIDTGNNSILKVNIETEDIDLPNYRTAGGGNYNSISRPTSMNLELTAHDYNKLMIAIANRGTASSITAGAVSDEAQTTPSSVAEDVLVPIDYVADVSSAMTVTGYVEDTDFTVTAAGPIVLASGSIPADTALAISYQKLATDSVQFNTSAASEVEVIFNGVNEAQSGELAYGRWPRCKFSPTDELSMIGDEFGEITVTAEVLEHTTLGYGKFETAT